MSPQDGTPDTVGIRIARARKRRGLSQTGLAERAAYSRGHIAQVESGHKSPTPAFVGAVARALGVDPAEIHGQPYRVEGSDDHVHYAIPALRRVMVTVGLGLDPDTVPRSLDVLDAEITTARGFHRDGVVSKSAAILPAVAEEAAHHAYGSDTPQAWAVYARALYASASLARRLGYTGDALALVAAQEAAAVRSQDPNLPQLGPLMRSLIQMTMGENDAAQAAIGRAMSAVDQQHRDGRELYGALALRSAIVAARSDVGRPTTDAWDRWGAADEFIRRDTIQPVHGLQATGPNSAIHGAAVAVELADPDEAIRRDERLGPRTLDALPGERRAHHAIDMARALVEVGAHGRALDRLVSAHHDAPQVVIFHPTARSVVAHLVDVRRTLPEPLRRLHSRMAV